MHLTLATTHHRASELLQSLYFPVTDNPPDDIYPWIQIDHLHLDGLDDQPRVVTTIEKEASQFAFDLSGLWDVENTHKNINSM